jgi:methylphosphotriester-DNA--protein-cysteine methyltransferase
VIRLQPGPELAPFVECLWYSDEREDVHARAPIERVLPTGRVSLVVRLSDAPVRVFDADAAQSARTFGHAVVGGTRSTYYVRDTHAPSVSLGVQFKPGGAAAWLGVPADELAERHTSLDVLWGRAANTLRERLLDTPSPATRLALFEAALRARAANARRIHPAVAAALAALGDCRGPAAVDTAWRASGFSRRHFIALFRRDVGLAPKVFARLQRFQSVLQRRARLAHASWAQIAAADGYADQAHLVREFQAFAGLAPSSYRPLAARPQHVPVSAFAARSIPSKRAARPRG